VEWRGAHVFAVSDLPLAGRGALEDAIAAAGAALEYGVAADAVARAVKSFRPLPHRLEVVARAGDITYIDDSKATNPHATLSAVRGLERVVLIAGGRSKGIDLSVLSATVPPVVGVVAIGEAADEVERVFSPLVETRHARTMRDAVASARALINGRGSVLLSPACASLDMYESYAARGDDFARAVQDLEAGRTDEKENADGQS
jgi:UDP-N-acetylmuramoylalanine--D-glutamate ligase